MSQSSTSSPGEPKSDGSDQPAMSIELPYPLTFSQRYRYAPLPEPMRLEYLSKDLRRELCDLIYAFLKTMTNIDHYNGHIVYSKVTFVDSGETYIKNILGRIKNCPRNKVSLSFSKNIETFQTIFTTREFNEILDYLEIMINEFANMLAKDKDFVYDLNEEGFINFPDRVRKLFIKHSSAYWLDISQYPYRFYPRASKEQGETTQQAIETVRQGRMDAAATHLRQAAEHINIGQYADSVADSIHAVESVARTIDPNHGDSLGKALNSLEDEGHLKHKALKQAFMKLYGYTSDEQGIRHALLDQNSADVGLDEAIFMFGACASFAAYLTRKHQQQTKT
ncbi:MAG: hypothetical protein OXF25_10515 [Cyanobacteria bacterium MAG CAR3_bin_5]|nr:hypothetical protein [Cyanobacteria bacterium MAG CAR3_bin_5]